MDSVTLANLYNRGGMDGKDRDRLDRLETAFARYLRSEGKHIRDIAAIMGVKMAKVKNLLDE